MAKDKKFTSPGFGSLPESLPALTERHSLTFRSADEPLTGAIGSLIISSLSGAPSLPTVDASTEEAHWRENFYSRSYVRPEHHWTQFAPAFELGWTARRRYPSSHWEDVQELLCGYWKERTDPSRPSWERLPWALACLAARDAWFHALSWFDDQEENTYWRERHARSPSACKEGYEGLRAAYRFGWEAKRRYAESSWPDAEDRLEGEWREPARAGRLPWSRARPAVRDAWRRVEASQAEGSCSRERRREKSPKS